ncbi:hypothetical protein MSAN_01352500 [Mycena sanguinolenta]|uniref:Uncharacterized protein n=1 Tax=Mycena sanguinolenta TaxID=230812 RepID=A0A8H6YFX4_9AGAR|nr:hypothetical protein MSAN_01352500 [Mycena sanguinolenta]
MPNSMDSEEPLARFLMQSPNVTRLEIISVRCAPTSRGLIAVLSHTPYLTHLELVFRSYHSVGHTFLDALSYKDGVTPLVPHLHSLILTKMSTNTTQCSAPAFEHLFVSRWATVELTSPSAPPSVARWSRVELRGKCNQQFMDKMETLQRMGLPRELQNLEQTSTSTAYRFL